MMLSTRCFRGGRPVHISEFEPSAVHLRIRPDAHEARKGTFQIIPQPKVRSHKNDKRGGSREATNSPCVGVGLLLPICCHLRQKASGRGKMHGSRGRYIVHMRRAPNSGGCMLDGLLSRAPPPMQLQ